MNANPQDGSQPTVVLVLGAFTEHAIHATKAAYTPV